MARSIVVNRQATVGYKEQQDELANLKVHSWSYHERTFMVIGISIPTVRLLQTHYT